MKTRQYNNGDTCTISANPGSHYTFDGWYENNTLVSSNNPYSFTVSSDKTLEGKFTAKSYTITTATSPVSGGSISGGGTYDYGDTCTLTATENAGFTFATWVDENNNFLSNSNPYTFTVSGDLTAKALFSSDYNTYTITVISNHGTVSGAGTYTLNDTCTLTSTPSPGYLFDHWEMNGVEISDDNPYSFTVNGDKTITAVYEVIPDALRITTSGPCYITLINSSNNTYSLSLNSGYNEYRGTEPDFALDEITSIRQGSNNQYYLSIDASDLTSLTSLPNSAFSYCTSLDTVVLPDSLTSLGYNAFGNCSSLISINIPDNVVYFGGSNGRVFYECIALPSINLPDSITTIGNASFCDCDSLTSITLSDSITTIGNNAFEGAGLTSINIPENVSSIGTMAFAASTGPGGGTIASMTVDANNQYYNDGNGSNCIIETATNTLISACKNTVIPNTVVAIGTGAFDGNWDITTPITIPASVSSIGNHAFMNSPNIPSITCLATTPPTLGNQVFYLTTFPIYVPSASLTAYQSAWTDYSSRLQGI